MAKVKTPIFTRAWIHLRHAWSQFDISLWRSRYSQILLSIEHLNLKIIGSLTVTITYFGLPVDACFQDAALPKTFQPLNPSRALEFSLSLQSLRKTKLFRKNLFEFRVDRDDNELESLVEFLWFFFFFSRQRSRQKFVENSFDDERKYASWVLSAATYPARERNKCVSRRFSFDILSRSSSSLFLPLYLCAFSLTMDQRAVLRAHTCAVLKERWRTSFLACITVCIGFVDSQYVQVACSGTGECQCRARVARHEKREHI